MNRRLVGESLYAGVLFAVTGALAWVSGRPFVFPSLGPSAYLLATVRSGESLTARRVVGGHLVGVLAGLVAYHALGAGVVVTAAAEPFGADHLRLAASGTLALVLTTGGMLATDTTHPPACATTLIVSLGLLPTVLEGGIIVGAVAVLFGAHAAAMGLWPAVLGDGSG